jgi:1-deoxy-D-xylulose-5-phosphate synthase
MHCLEIGKAHRLRTGATVAILGFGSLVNACLLVGEQLNATVINMRFIKPLDVSLVLELARTHTIIVTVEENAVMGGAGSAVNELLALQGYRGDILNLGLPDTFLEHGNPDKMLSMCGLDAPGILAAIKNRLDCHAIDTVVSA